MGRSRGGLTTKIHAVVDASGLPLRFALSPGQSHDSTLAGHLLDDQLPPDSFVLADKPYDAEWIRAMIEAQDGRRRRRAEGAGRGARQASPRHGPAGCGGRRGHGRDEAGGNGARQPSAELCRGYCQYHPEAALASLADGSRCWGRVVRLLRAGRRVAAGNRRGVLRQSTPGVERLRRRALRPDARRLRVEGAAARPSHQMPAARRSRAGVDSPLLPRCDPGPKYRPKRTSTRQRTGRRPWSRPSRA